MTDIVPSFANHIRPLFREGDIHAMKYSFDLASYDDVRTHAKAILARVEDGAMPCDVMWPMERVELFQLWLATGMAP